MTTLVNLDGRLVAPEQALVSVYDRGFLFGDSVYETLRTYSGRPFLLDRHLARLERSAERIALSLPGGRARVAREVARTLAAAEHADSALRVVVTRGARIGVVDLDPQVAGEPLLVIYLREFKPYPAALHDDGVEVALVGVRRTARDSLDPSVKSGNYLNNLTALAEARARGAFECVMLNQEGLLTEGSTSNVFLVKAGVLRTPALDCGLLDGITRGFLLDVAHDEGIAAREERLLPQDLADADEVFITSSLKEVMPVTTVDGRPVGDGRPGPVSRRLLEAYRRRVREVLWP